MVEDLVERTLKDKGYHESKNVYDRIDWERSHVLRNIESELELIASGAGIKITNYVILPPALVPGSVAASEGLPLAIYVRESEKIPKGIVETIY